VVQGLRGLRQMRDSSGVHSHGALVYQTDETITGLLREWARGDAPAGDRLFTIVYDELRAIARRQRRRWRGDDTLDTTALAHEVYLRLRGSEAFTPSDRAHFFAVAARATRQILSNYARRQHATKRGAGETPLSLQEFDMLAPAWSSMEWSSIDRLWDLEVALRQLEAINPRACQVVECRYFGGLSIPATAAALDISEATVKRDWALAQAWLFRVLREHGPDAV
jgi:RNA polymerase sigma factor (TIGR02999 family)